jgi:hypothetical protein
MMLDHAVQTSLKFCEVNLMRTIRDIATSRQTKDFTLEMEERTRNILESAVSASVFPEKSQCSLKGG